METSGKKIAFVVCGALLPEVSRIVKKRGWAVELHPLPSDYHLDPQKIVSGVEEKLRLLLPNHRVLVVYGDCGTGGMLDKLLARYGVERLAGAHCYEIYGGDVFWNAVRQEPGTFFLTDFMVRSFARLERQMGIDAHPELVSMYFGNYRRMLYLAQTRDERLLAEAEKISKKLGLPLEVRFVGVQRLEEMLSKWIERTSSLSSETS